MRLLLINPICYDSIDNFIQDSKTRKINCDEILSLEYLSAYIKRELPEIEVEIYDWHFDCLKWQENRVKTFTYMFNDNIAKEEFEYLLKQKLKEYNPDVVGVSCLYEYSAQPFHETLRIIKEVNKDIITIVGGIYSTTNTEKCEQDKNIDYIVKSEGEYGFKILLDYIIKNKHKQIKKWLQANIVQNLDDLPLPDRVKDFPLYATYGRQLTQRFYKDNCRTASILISRGCINHCTYCSGHVITNRDYRHRSVENIVNEIKDLKENYDIEVFMFHEENPCIDIEFTKSLYKALIPLKIKWVSQAGFYVNKMDYEFVKLAIDSGVLFFNLAIESGSKNILRKIKKPVGIIENAPKVVKWIRELKPEIYVNLFIMAGFSFETIDDIQQSIDFAKKLDANWTQWNLLQLFKGCELYEQCKNNLDGRENTDNFYLTGRLKDCIVEKETLDKMINESNLDLNFRNNYDLRHGYYEQAERDASHVLLVTEGKHEEAKILYRKAVSMRLKNEHGKPF